MQIVSSAGIFAAGETIAADLPKAEIVALKKAGALETVSVLVPEDEETVEPKSGGQVEPPLQQPPNDHAVRPAEPVGDLLLNNGANDGDAQPDTPESNQNK